MKPFVEGVRTFKIITRPCSDESVYLRSLNVRNGFYGELYL